MKNYPNWLFACTVKRNVVAILAAVNESNFLPYRKEYYYEDKKND